MAKKTRRRGKGLGTVYRRGHSGRSRGSSNGVKQYEHGFPDEDTARRVLAVDRRPRRRTRRAQEVSKPAGPLAQLVEEWLKVAGHASLG